MSTRDELAETAIERVRAYVEKIDAAQEGSGYADHIHSLDDVVLYRSDLRLIAEGWRKKPTVRHIAESLHADDCPDDECEGGDLGHYERQAELVLALMDRGQ